MQVGVTFPQTDIDPDGTEIRQFAAEAERLGYDHILAYDHILGVEPPDPHWGGTYDYTDQFIEPFVLFSHQAAVTQSLSFIVGVLVLPQRDTELVAKQAATIDVLSDSRLILGAGVGWNDLEYANLGKDFTNRGQKIEEQLTVLRELWKQDLVTFEGNWHELDCAGINPRPISDSIPLWLGGGADIVLRRVARQADGWIAPTDPLDTFEQNVQLLREYLSAEGKDPHTFPIHGRIKLGSLDRDEWIAHLNTFERLGISHVGVGTMDMGLSTTEEHVSVLQSWRSEIEDLGYV